MLTTHADFYYYRTLRTLLGAAAVLWTILNVGCVAWLVIWLWSHGRGFGKLAGIERA
jgi:hypothetical protein